MAGDDAGAAADAASVNMACFRLTRALEELDYTVPEAAPLARHLLRVVGRIVIDTAAEGAQPETWANTEEMVLLWIDEALRAHGYEIKPIPGGGRPDLPDVSEDWSTEP